MSKLIQKCADVCGKNTQVYLVLHDSDGIESFIGIFTSLEKAKNAAAITPSIYGNVQITKIDTNKFYFTPISEELVVIEIGEHVECLDCPSETKGFTKKEFLDDYKDLLHHTNNLNDFVDKLN